MRPAAPQPAAAAARQAAPAKGSDGETAGYTRIDKRTGSPVTSLRTTADGWTFGAAWPVADGFSRVQYWLVDADGKVLLCKTGSDRGEKGIKDLAEVCNAAKELLYTA